MSTPTLREAAQAPASCPFCKSAKIGVHQHKQRRAVGYKAMCLGCGISQTGMAYGSPEQAIAAWNTRAALTQAADAGAAKVDSAVDKTPDLQGSLVDKTANLQGQAVAAEPVAYGVWDSMFFYDFFHQEDAAQNFCARKNAEPADNLQPYRYAPLYTAPPAQQLQQAVARALAERDADGELWAVNVQGPDDVYPCESRLAALELANKLNASFIAQQEKDHHEYDPIMRAVVIPWDFSAEEHAAAIRQQGTP